MFYKDSQLLPHVVGGDLRCLSTKILCEKKLTVFGSVSLQKTFGVFPDELHVFGNTAFQSQAVPFPDKMSLSGDVKLQECQTQNFFGKNTKISADLEFNYCGVVELHPSLVVCGTISTKNTLLLVPEAALQNCQTFAPDAKFIVLNKESSLISVLSQVGDYAETAKLAQNYAEDIKCIFKDGHSSSQKLKNWIFSKSKEVQLRVSTNIEDHLEKNILLSNLSSPFEQTIFSRSLHLRDSDIQHLPERMKVADTLVIDNCPNLESLPDDLFATSLHIKSCPSLTHIPENVRYQTLVLQQCNALKQFSAQSDLAVSVTVRDCEAFSPLNAFFSRKGLLFSSTETLYASAEDAHLFSKAEVLPKKLVDFLNLLKEDDRTPAHLATFRQLQKDDGVTQDVLQELQESEYAPKIKELLAEDAIIQQLQTAENTSLKPPILSTINGLLSNIKKADDIQDALALAKELPALSNDELLELIVNDAETFEQKQFLKSLMRESSLSSLSKPKLVL